MNSWWRVLAVTLVCVSFFHPSVARRFTQQLSDQITQHLHDSLAEQAGVKALSRAQMESLLSAKLEARLEPAGPVLLEVDNKVEEEVWNMHMDMNHDPHCVASIFPICRKHRDWCRQECDHHHPESHDRCHSEKCDVLLQSCHRAHFGRCDKGDSQGVHSAWSSPMDSQSHCQQYVEDKCSKARNSCEKKCTSQHGPCEPTHCATMQYSCQKKHRYSCGDHRNNPLPAAGSSSSHHSGSSASSHSGSHHSSSSSSSSGSSSHHDESSHHSSSSASLGSDRSLPSPPDPESASMNLKVGEYIKCEEAVGKKCEEEVHQCLKACVVKNTDKDTKPHEKCNPDHCYRIHESCSDRSDNECGPKKTVHQQSVTAEILKPNEHFCHPKDTSCHYVAPDTVEKVECTPDNDYCKSVKSQISSCDSCEQKRFKCHEKCKSGEIVFSSRYGPTSQSPCSDQHCFEEAELCHASECKAVKAHLVEAQEQPEGTARKALEQERRVREKIAHKQAQEEAHKVKVAYGMSTTLPSTCGNGAVDHGEQCDGGDGCSSSCSCRSGYKAHSPPRDSCSGGPAPCTFARSGCMYGSQQVTPQMVPRGSLMHGVPLP